MHIPEPSVSLSQRWGVEDLQNTVSAPFCSNTTLVAYDQHTFQLSLNKMGSPKYSLYPYAANTLHPLEAEEMHYGNTSILLTCTLILLTNSIFAGPFPTYPVQWHTNLFQGRTYIYTHIPLSLPSLQMFSLTLNFITATRGKWTASSEKLTVSHTHANADTYIHTYSLWCCAFFLFSHTYCLALDTSVCFWQLDDLWKHFGMIIFCWEIAGILRHAGFLWKPSCL